MAITKVITKAGYGLSTTATQAMQLQNNPAVIVSPKKINYESWGGLDLAKTESKYMELTSKEVPDKAKDPKLLEHYTQLINFEIWEQSPQLRIRYKVGSHHKMEGMIFKVIKYDKYISTQHEKQIKIQFIEDPTVSITGPDDTLMAGIPITNTKQISTSNTTPKKVVEPFVPKTEREKMFSELTNRELTL